MDTPITRAEHEEFRKRIEEENRRQDARIKGLEDKTDQISNLTVSVEKLAQSIQMMVKEQERQGQRLAELEGRDGEMWRKVIGYAITAVVGIVVGYVFTQFGM